ncbi:site-specific integrase [Flavobacterium sp. F372]|uniref:Site-specific integrase n=1 Tax=Flavobacterium bernardetii TaxID=2813823 RepID=A0ABR7J1W2_9FLAO|nr:site-specific integrase [Flavobacterium bernardetii]MBC5835834.1 site-specific integrase [Flavobacterium bernardetii]NHF69564.1 site-specific integrase [Flavobacterium bernardetii]
MRILNTKTDIFDTQISTKKLFVPMKHKFTLRNYINKEGEALLYLKVNHKNELERIPLGLYANPKNWNQDKSRMTDNSQKSQDLNLILENIESKITAIKTTYRLSERFLTVENFVYEFHHGIPRIDFVAFWSSQLDLQKEIVHKNTHKKEKSVLKKFREFKPRVMFTDLDFDVILKFKAFMIKRKMLATSINSNLKVLKKYLKIAEEAGIKMPLNIRAIKIGSTNGNRNYLNEEELKKLNRYFHSEFINETYRIPLALFLTSCFTGLRISDMQQIELKNIVDGALKFTSIKTKKNQNVKLNKYALQILEACPEMLVTKFTDQYINRILKDICKDRNINKIVTFHVARHTFATNYLKQGGKVEVLQKILAHSNIKETMIYVTILQEDQDKEIQFMDNMNLD